MKSFLTSTMPRPLIECLQNAISVAGQSRVLMAVCGQASPRNQCSSTADEALGDWAEAYGDQTEAHHAVLVKAIKGGRAKAVTGV